MSGLHSFFWILFKYLLCWNSFFSLFLLGCQSSLQSGTSKTGEFSQKGSPKTASYHASDFYSENLDDSFSTKPPYPSQFTQYSTSFSSPSNRSDIRPESSPPMTRFAPLEIGRFKLSGNTNAPSEYFSHSELKPLAEIIQSCMNRETIYFSFPKEGKTMGFDSLFSLGIFISGLQTDCREEDPKIDIPAQEVELQLVLKGWPLEKKTTQEGLTFTQSLVVPVGSETYFNLGPVLVRKNMKKILIQKLSATRVLNCQQAGAVYLSASENGDWNNRVPSLPCSWKGIQANQSVFLSLSIYTDEGELQESDYSLH